MKTDFLGKVFVLENITFRLVEILVGYHSIMDEINQETLSGLEKSIDTLDEEHEAYPNDIKYCLDIAIILCTGFENQMNEADQEEIEESMLTIADIDAIEELYIGKLVIYEELPYKIFDIDYDDITILIGDREDENGMWVRPSNIK